MRLSIEMFKKELVSCGRWKIGYTSGKRGLVYISHTTDSKLIDKTFGSDRPTVRALAELAKACKR